MPTPARVTSQDFAILMRKVRTLPHGKFLFINAEFDPTQLFKLNNDPRIAVITARESSGNINVVHCICRKEDVPQAVEKVKSAIADIGGKNIISKQVN